VSFGKKCLLDIVKLDRLIWKYKVKTSLTKPIYIYYLHIGEVFVGTGKSKHN
jgi:hypothetical protein